MRSTLAILALILMGIGVPLASAQTNGIQYNQAAGIVTLTTEEIDIKVTGANQAPHFHWWDPNNPTVDYHVMFVKLFEANDTNSNGVYDLGTDLMLGPAFALPAINWDFSGFDVDEENGSVTEVHFNFTTTTSHDPRPDGPGGYGNLPDIQEFDLMIQVLVHMDLSEPGEFKFDLVIDGWVWSDSDSILVLQFNVAESNHGQNEGEREPAGFQQKTQSNFTFGNAYMECAEEAFAAQNEVQVKASHGQPAGLEAAESVYLAFEYFGNETLEYDPTLGIESSTYNLLTDPLVLLAAGAGVVLILVLVVRMRK
ncbi:MAG: hypothetical protein RTU92_14005 [Candidatus Thorarchaeota archaeon]